jgi:periodic tryptophan protein 1
MSNLISAVAWVKRGVTIQHPQKYVLDDKELQRVSTLARIELEDARVEMERAHKAAQEMGKGDEGDEVDDISKDGKDVEEEDGNADWVESVHLFFFFPQAEMDD